MMKVIDLNQPTLQVVYRYPWDTNKNHYYFPFYWQQRPCRSDFNTGCFALVFRKGFFFFLIYYMLTTLQDIANTHFDHQKKKKNYKNKTKKKKIYIKSMHS